MNSVAKIFEMADTHKTADPCVMVIFGATGDLTKRKLFPALYNLAKDKFLPDNFAIIGVGRQEMATRGISRADDRRPEGIRPDRIRTRKLIKWF